MTNWKELFKNRNIVFHCETEIIANKLLKIAHELGYKWTTGTSYLEKNNWHDDKENTCYRIFSGNYQDKDFYIEDGKEIINTKSLFDKPQIIQLKRKITTDHK